MYLLATIWIWVRLHHSLGNEAMRLLQPDMMSYRSLAMTLTVNLIFTFGDPIQRSHFMSSGLSLEHRMVCLLNTLLVIRFKRD
jgi:hypothetical protein